MNLTTPSGRMLLIGLFLSANVIPGLAQTPPPVPVLKITSLSGRQNNDTFGVASDGTVTLRLDAAASWAYAANVSLPQPADGFYWEWPANPTIGYNNGLSENPPKFDEGAIVEPQDLPASRASVQTYRFRFNPSSLPRSILIGLQVVQKVREDGTVRSTTIFKRIAFMPNGGVEPEDLSILNFVLYRVTDGSAAVSFDLMDRAGTAVSGVAEIRLSTSSGTVIIPTQGTLRQDGSVRFNLNLTSLSPDTVYALSLTGKVRETTGMVRSCTGNELFFQTLRSGTPR